MAMTSEHGTFTRPPADGRKSIRYVAAALCGIVGLLYLILLFLVADAEFAPGAVVSDTTYGAYLFLAVPYVVGAALLVAVDRRVLWAVGSAVQVLVIALFVMFGVGMFGPGVFEYDALSALRMELWAAVITGAQVILFGLLCYLALPPTRLGTEPGPPATPGAQTPLHT